MDIAFQNNQTFTQQFNLSEWKPIYPLTLCVFHVQVRKTPGEAPIVYSWSSNPSDGWQGTMTYTNATGILTMNAPYSEMIELEPGDYKWDMVLIYNDFYKVLTGGAFKITDGITQ